MNALVFVETESDFLTWIEMKSTSGDTPIDTSDDSSDVTSEEPAQEVDVAVAGRELFLNLGCGACHVLTDASTTGVLGPNMDGFAERAGSRVIGQDAISYTKESVVEPNAFVVEGFPPGIMPQNFGDRLTVEELDALITYLLNQ